MPLTPTVTNEQINEIKVECRHSNANVREDMVTSFDCPVPYNKELLLRSYHDFMNNTGNESLHCNSGEQLFSSFRQVLGATQKTKWDVIINAFGRTPANFQTASLAYINEVLGPGAANKQQSYFNCLTSKPCSMAPQTLMDRIDEINMLMIPCADNQNSLNGPFSNEHRRSLFERLQPQVMKDEALKQNITAANPHVTDDALVILYQNLLTVKTTNKKRSNSFQNDRRAGCSRPNNCGGGYISYRPYGAQSPFQQQPFTGRYGSPTAPAYGQVHQGG